MKMYEVTISFSVPVAGKSPEDAIETIKQLYSDNVIDINNEEILFKAEEVK